jgi:multidrug transporter EmrE-like cation transporter
LGGSINLVGGVSMGGTHVSHWTRPVWMAVPYLAICGSLASYTSYLFLLRNVRLSAVATYAYINPVVAVVLGSLLLNESLQAMQLAGMIIVLVSVAPSQRQSRLGKKQKATRRAVSKSQPQGDELILPALADAYIQDCLQEERSPSNAHGDADDLTRVNTGQRRGKPTLRQGIATAAC